MSHEHNLSDTMEVMGCQLQLDALLNDKVQSSKEYYINDMHPSEGYYVNDTI